MHPSGRSARLCRTFSSTTRPFGARAAFAYRRRQQLFSRAAFDSAQATLATLSPLPPPASLICHCPYGNFTDSRNRLGKAKLAKHRRDTAVPPAQGRLLSAI